MTDPAQPISDEPIADEPASYDVEATAVRFRSGRVIDVRTDEVRMPGGSTVSRDVVVHPGAVGIIALDDDERVLLVQQYRHPAQRMLWEPPAGLLDVEDEPPLEAAQRELAEEGGVTAHAWHVLVDAFTSPGMCDEAVRVYLARGITPVGEDERYVGEDEEADMPTTWLPLDEVVRAAFEGRLHNPMGIMGVLATAHARASGFAGLRAADAPWPEVNAFTGSTG